MKTNEIEPSSNMLISLLGSAGALLLFALIIWLTYIPTRSDKVDIATRTQRENQLVETKARATKTLNNYSIVNSAEGIYRIPIEKAMQLTVESYQK